MIAQAPGSVRVLFVEDDKAYAHILERRLEEAVNPSFQIDHVGELKPALERLGEKKVDVVLLDLGLPDSQGLETLARVHKKAPEVPVVVSSALDEATTGIEAVRGGAEDYLVKNRLIGREIARSLQYAVERHRLREDIQSQLLKDDLTGLYNRRGFTILAEQQIKLSLRMRQGFILFFMDIDHFKNINDTYGHAQGDRALVDFRKILKSTFRESDILARLGGDEFVVLTNPAREDLSDHLLARLKKNIASAQAVSPASYTLAVSVGINRFDPAFPHTLTELMEEADRAMYREKRSKQTRA